MIIKLISNSFSYTGLICLFISIWWKEMSIDFLNSSVFFISASLFLRWLHFRGEDEK